MYFVLTVFQTCSLQCDVMFQMINVLFLSSSLSLKARTIDCQMLEKSQAVGKQHQVYFIP